MIKTSLVAAILVCAYAVSTLADEGSTGDARARQIFKNFDANGDGYISFEEYKAGMAGNISPERIVGVFQEKDRNGDGKLTLGELLYVPMDQRPPASGSTPVKKSDKRAGKDSKKAANQ
jgi:Ca2+-binding EF-hand superfamily protein